MSKLFSRRRIVQGLMAAAALVAMPITAFARNSEAFGLGDFAKARSTMFGGQDIADGSDGITLELPDIAESPAKTNVKVKVDEAKLGALKSITFMAEVNPTPISAKFYFSPRVEPELETFIKLAGTTMVHAIVETEKGLYSASKEVKATLGGCGG
jgi:sulfur-oxidizing protein SoxY